MVTRFPRLALWTVRLLPLYISPALVKPQWISLMKYESFTALGKKKIILAEQATLRVSCVSSYSNSSLQREELIFVLQSNCISRAGFDTRYFLKFKVFYSHARHKHPCISRLCHMCWKSKLPRNMLLGLALLCHCILKRNNQLETLYFRIQEISVEVHWRILTKYSPLL